MITANELRQMKGSPFKAWLNRNLQSLEKNLCQTSIAGDTCYTIRLFEYELLEGVEFFMRQGFKVLYKKLPPWQTSTKDKEEYAVVLNWNEQV